MFALCIHLLIVHNAALIGGAICWGRVASHAKRDSRSSALFGAPMPLCFIFIYYFIFFSVLRR
jgi:hypothetical protein